MVASWRSGLGSSWRFLSIPVSLVAAILSGAGAASAQQPPETLPFFWPDQAFENHGVDNVNLYNGDDGIAIPLGPAYTLGPTGYQYQLTAYHSLKFWHFSAAACPPNTQFAWIAGDPTIGVGWSLLPGYVVKRASGVTEYYSPNGGVSQITLPTSSPYSAVTMDGSHLRITGNSASPTSYTVEFPDGTIGTFNHAYAPPTSSPASLDFSNLDHNEGALSRYGLTSMQDRFGNSLFTVSWGSGMTAAEVSTITLVPFNSTITFTWTTYLGGTGITRPVLDNILFPAASGKQLKVKFNFQDGIFNRNSFDNSVITGGCPPASPTQVKVPELSSIAFSDPGSPATIIPFSYSMSYLGTAGMAVQKQGAINVMTLPNGGTVTYGYCVVGPMPCVVGANCNPSAARTQNNCDVYTPEDPEPPPPGTPDSPDDFHPPGQVFFDASPAVGSRAEFDPYANRTNTITYDRDQFKGLIDGVAQDSLVIRRTAVTVSGNDDMPTPLGTPSFVRRYYFKVDSGDPNNPRGAAGIELDRRYFNGTDVTQPPVRTLITCYSGDSGGCGYGSDDGEFIDYDFTTSGRTPPTSRVTWYGAASSTSPGICASATTKCSAVVNTNYNPVAGQYKTVQMTSTLPNTDIRTVETNWTYNTNLPPTGHWVLGLFDHRYTWDGGGSVPSGSNGDTVVRQHFDFDVDGFLNEIDTWDSPSGKAIGQCFYQSTPALDGTVADEYSQTFSSPSEPTGTLCAASIPSTGSGGDVFGQHHTYASLLPAQTYWRNGTGSIGWNSLDVMRDGTTGFITDNRDPNYTSTNNLKTSYTYDVMGRVIQIQPPGGSAVEWPTTFCYIPKLSTSTGLVLIKKIKQAPTLDPNSTTGICQRDDASVTGPILGQQLDGFGRSVRELRRNNKALSTTSYFETRDTWFDTAGHLKFSGDWRPCGTGSGVTNVGSCAVNQSAFTGPGKFFAYFDAFGRAGGFADVNGANYASEVLLDRTDTRVSPSIPFSDSYEQAQTMCVNGTWSGSTCSGAIGGNSGAYSATELDNLGRITKETEPNTTSGVLSSDTTTYSYNVLDQSDQVVQLTSGSSQTRTFTYSAFGFLKSEQTPENGQSGNATTTYSSYGSLGNLLAKSDGNPTSTTYAYSYDAAGRLTLVNAGGAKFLSNCYDGTGICGDTSVPNFAGGSFPKGRLSRREGLNQIPFQAALVFDDFSYSDSSGRLSAMTTSVGSKATDLTKNGFGFPVTQSWTYNTLGAIATHVHPRPSSSTTTLTVNDSTYTAGFLTNITATKQMGSPVQIVSANYHESGRLSDYTVGNSPAVTTTISADSVIPSRPSRFLAKTPSTTLWDSGSYVYDGGSSVKKIGTTDTFVYDGRSRITSAAYTGTGGGTQGFTFDRYGNLTSKTGINAVPLTTTATTNHLIGTIGTYDDRGNLATFTSGAGTQTVFHDLLNRMYRTVDPSGSDMVYLYDGGGERIAKFPTDLGATRREFARVIIEGRGDTGLTCTAHTNAGGFGDVPCDTNPNDGPYINQMGVVGITSGCGSGNYCPNDPTTRQQAAVLFLNGELIHCPLGTTNCTWTPPACTPPPNQRFADVPCPSQYADWIEELADEGITAGCGGGNFCPTQVLGSWQMLAWAQKIWPGYCPLPRTSVLTYRDEGARVITEANQLTSGDDTSETVTYPRDNVFLGSQLVSSAVWSGSTPSYQFFAVDHLGSTRLATDMAGTVVETYKYWPYGDDGPGTGTANQRLTFAGMERDTENKHYFDHARTQDFNIGRFVSADRTWGGQGAPQSWNRYSYVMNQPTSLTDPWGFAPPFCYDVPNADHDGTHIECRPASYGPSSSTGNTGTDDEGGDGLLACVARTAEAHSMQHYIQTFSGGRLGNSSLSGALFGNSFAALINVFEQHSNDVVGAVKATAPELGTIAGANALERGAHIWSSFRVVTDTTTTLAVVTPAGVSLASITTTAVDPLPMTDAFKATAGIVSDFLEFKGWFDLGVAALSAVDCMQKR